MTAADYMVIAGFLGWMLLIGWIFSRKVKDSSDMFAAGGRSPWWVSGLSGFMTIFSAGTFVVWGGIAFRLGLVAVTILMVIGLSSIAAGWLAAGRWRRMGIKTPTEFLRIRFDEPVAQAYIWLGMVYRGIGLGIGLYALAVMLSVLIPLPEGAPFRDPVTGNLSVEWSIVLWGTVVVVYTMAGGLWAVLMTDVIQCLILCLVVLVAVPLSLSAAGGPAEFLSRSPPGFFALASGEYTWTFLFLWFWLGVFRYAADWAFVQRYICVPTARDARKVAYLMGALYLVSPILWMLPAMAYRIIDPSADPEKAYMLVCSRVLPAGMLGVMVAAMFSATASMASSLLNVFAGVFTCDVYKALIDRKASERRLVLVGRLATLLYGALAVLIALAVPHVGGAENLVIVLITSLLGPLMLPTVWGLFSRHVGPWAVWATLLVCTPAALLVKVLPGLKDRVSFLQDPSPLGAVLDWVGRNSKLTDGILGLLLPLGVLIVVEILSRRKGVHPGWRRMEEAFSGYAKLPPPPPSSRLPAKVIALSLGILTLLMIVTTACNPERRITLSVFSALLLAATAATARAGFKAAGP